MGEEAQGRCLSAGVMVGGPEGTAGTIVLSLPFSLWHQPVMAHGVPALQRQGQALSWPVKEHMEITR